MAFGVVKYSGPFPASILLKFSLEWRMGFVPVCVSREKREGEEILAIYSSWKVCEWNKTEFCEWKS